MLTTSEKKFSSIYGIIVCLELLTGSLETLSALHYIFKPAILISLLIFFILKSNALHKPLRLIIILALVFSLAGDVFLMFVDVSPNYFLLGLIAFLVAHIMYVIAFLKQRNKAAKPFGFITFLMLFASGLFYFLKDGLHDMLIPVVIYMLVILSMSTAAFMRKGNVSKRSYILVFLGALFFMISDSILALNKFYEPLAYSNINIMLTYALAQYLIIIGLLKLDQASH
ncbi:lysoplasmalogenase [Psychroserpens damuponensis]|uniref:lysoplasmalogenase n=1 Tax=Psychroserpens damuponensis TaxID=943936 RepID=UPI00058B8AEB|nr:lysoplasmalogenase [Psychroserpens damuponensis]